MEEGELSQTMAAATTAAQQQQWTLVNQYLQQLPLDSASPHRESVLALAIQVLRQGDFQQRWDTAKLLPKLGKEAIAPLIEILEDDEMELELRWFAGRILSEFDDPQAIVALTELLRQTEEEELSLMAAQALANIGSTAVEALQGLLAQETTRLLAVQALGVIRRSEIITPLLTVVDDPSPQVRVIAVEALGSFHDPRIPRILIEKLNDRSAAVRKEAVIALGMRLDLKSELNLVEHLQPLLYDFNLEVCRQAAIALGRMGSNEAAQALFRVFSSSAPAPLKIDTVRALSWIDTITALEYLEAALQKSEAERQEIIVLLGQKTSPALKAKATEILLNFYPLVQSPPLKQALAMSLGELAQPQAIDTLLELSKDPQQSVRLHARAALHKLAVHQN